jgi:type VI secretion system protein ImpC
MQMESWQELSQSARSDQDLPTPEYAAWKSLRESEDSRYIGLAMPRFLARLPYGAKTDPVEEFDFEEDTGGPDHASYTWSNSAYAMASTSIGPSSSTAGARASAAWSPAARSRGCRFTPSRPTTAAWT